MILNDYSKEFKRLVTKLSKSGSRLWQIFISRRIRAKYNLVEQLLSWSSFTAVAMRSAPGVNRILQTPGSAVIASLLGFYQLIHRRTTNEWCKILDTAIVLAVVTMKHTL
jgi:hypothetical protein